MTQAAREIYQLNGALPNTDYVIMLHVYGPDPVCPGDGRAVLPTTITTNDAGNGQTSRDFLASPGPPRPPTTSLHQVGRDAQRHTGLPDRLRRNRVGHARPRRRRT